VPAAEQSKDGVKTFDVRVGPDGRPLIHGASFKGALRSAYETITASRYGVFFEHDDRLAYRSPARHALTLTPARVCRDGDTTYFLLCRGDADWTKYSQRGNLVQDAVWVPAYKGQKVHRIGALAKGDLTDHHGKKVYARVVLCQYERSGQKAVFQVWRATHLALTQRELEAALRKTTWRDESFATGHLTLVRGAAPKIVRGWLSATGYSIGTKHDERLFVASPDAKTVPVTEEHKKFWRSVLRSYDLAHGYNDPNATYSRDPSPNKNGVVRSRHVPSSPQMRELPPGTLVYVKYDEERGDVTEVHSVMIGRQPFEASPSELLHESLRPADRRDQLSPLTGCSGGCRSGGVTTTLRPMTAPLVTEVDCGSGQSPAPPMTGARLFSHPVVSPSPR